MLVFLLGGIAVTLSSITMPAQLRHLWSNRRNPDILRGASPTTLVVVMLSSITWCAYGIKTGAVWVLVSGALDGVVCLASLLLLRRFHLAAIAPLAVAAVLFLPATVLGVVGATVGVGMFVPQAAAVWRARGTAAAGAFSPWSSLNLIVANGFWFAYGWLLDDPLLWAPPVLHAACGALMLSVRLAGADGPFRQAKPAVMAPQPKGTHHV